MTRILCSFALSISLLSATLYTPKADALVGLIFKSRAAKTVGGIAALSGVTGAGVSLAVGVAGQNLATAVVAILGVYAGGILAGIGLVILDDNTIADIEFKSLNLSDKIQFRGFSVEEAQIYNSELSLLNSIRKTISIEVSDSEDTADAEALWLEYSDYLSPATFEIAKVQAAQFFKALK